MYNEIISSTLYKVVVAYLIGSIPFSVLASKYLLKKDIRKVGSGNIGVSNAYRAGGFLFSLAVAIVDVSKGFFVCSYLLPSSLGMLAVCVGQMFPITLGLHGGKGVACYIGSLAATNPVAAAVLGFGWMLLTKVTKMPFIASMLLLLASVSFVQVDRYVALTMVLIFVRHKSNIVEFFNKFAKKKNSK